MSKFVYGINSRLNAMKKVLQHWTSVEVVSSDENSFEIEKGKKEFKSK